MARDTSGSGRQAAIAYAAKSTEDKRGSIPDQLADCHELAEREGWEIAGEYQDEAASAYSGNRGPGLAAAKKLAEDLAPSILVVQHSDRLARGDGRTADHLADLYSWAVRANVTIRSVQDDLFADERIGRVMAALMGMRNTEDSKRKSEAVKAGLKRRRDAGLHTGGPAPYGTEYREGDQVPVKSLAPIVRRMFTDYAAGRSQLSIARSLAADGVPTAKGGEWHQGTVRSILANDVYVGLGMIDADTWTKVEQLREARTRNPNPGRAPVGQHLFRKGMLRCSCGEALVPRTDANRRDRPYEVYRCYGRHQDPDSCSMPPLPRAMIDTAVYSYFEKVGLDVDATRQQLAESRDAKLAEVRALLDQAEKEARAAGEALARVRRDYQRGAIEADDWAEQRPQLTEEHEAAEAEVERLSKQAAEVESWGELRDVESDLLRNLTELRQAIAGEIRNAEGIEAVRAVLTRLFDGFTVHRAAEGSPDGVFVGNTGDVLDGLFYGGTATYLIEANTRHEVFEGYDEELQPILRREPLSQAEKNYANTLVR